jgi:hypothetical protein
VPNLIDLAPWLQLRFSTLVARFGEVTSYSLILAKENKAESRAMQGLKITPND